MSTVERQICLKYKYMLRQLYCQHWMHSAEERDRDKFMFSGAPAHNNSGFVGLFKNVFDLLVLSLWTTGNHELFLRSPTNCLHISSPLGNTCLPQAGQPCSEMMEQWSDWMFSWFLGDNFVVCSDFFILVLQVFMIFDGILQPVTWSVFRLASHRKKNICYHGNHAPTKVLYCQKVFAEFRLPVKQ